MTVREVNNKNQHFDDRNKKENPREIANWYDFDYAYSSHRYTEHKKHGFLWNFGIFVSHLLAVMTSVILSGTLIFGLTVSFFGHPVVNLYTLSGSALLGVAVYIFLVRPSRQ